VRERVLEKSCGGKKIYFERREFVCDRCKNRFGISLFKFRQQHHGLHIGAQIEKIFRRDLSSHDRVMNVL
jgi:hypothetical protein